MQDMSVEKINPGLVDFRNIPGGAFSGESTSQVNILSAASMGQYPTLESDIFDDFLDYPGLEDSVMEELEKF